jgi:hypothetical protein
MSLKVLYLPIFFEKEYLKAMPMMKMLKAKASISKIFLFFSLSLLSLPAMAQTEEEIPVENPDSVLTPIDPFSDYGIGGGSSNRRDDDEGPKKPKFVRRPYDRFLPPSDTITGLITYIQVVKVIQLVKNEETEVERDSIIFRTKKWLEKEFGKKEAKRFIQNDGENKEGGESYIILVHGRFPLYVENNDFVKIPSGEVEFIMELRIREGVYRYKINNLVHILPPVVGSKEERRTYFEFYKNVKENIKAGDMVMIAADKKINSMMSDLKLTCEGPPSVDEEDWE